MTTNTQSQSDNGIGIFTVLFLIFLTLKLCGVIAWSWWWVTAPLWIPAAIVLTILVLIGVVLGIRHLREC